MNTPAHLIVNLAVLGGGERRVHLGAITVGSLLPDLPMFAFFLWERVVLETPGMVIWDERYFDARWQACFDLFNSIPILAVAWMLAWWARRHAMVWLASSAILHCLLDLPFHREDGHRHFFPFSDWRFMSPVSYWDPAHGGTLGSGFETLALLGACAVLWQRHPRASARIPLAALALFSVSVWIAFYGLGIRPF